MKIQMSASEVSRRYAGRRGTQIGDMIFIKPFISEIDGKLEVPIINANPNEDGTYTVDLK